MILYSDKVMIIAVFKLKRKITTLIIFWVAPIDNIEKLLSIIT